jgi:DNA polymerase-3 subunit delta'
MSGVILSRVRSQDTAVQVLRRAVAGNSVHHAYLFDGPAGVGKELAALGLAQALVCERRKPGDSDACGDCSACIRTNLTEDRVTKHPDITFLERGLYEPTRIGRKSPESQDISIDQVRTLVLARAACGAHEGRAKVFIIRRAEELGTSAANALLKTLEEPGDKTHFILLSAQAADLLPTVRSRTMRVRFGSLPEATVKSLLLEQGKDEAVATRAAALAGGTMTEALISADPELLAERDAFVSHVLDAIARGDKARGYELAEQAKKDKVQLDADLTALARALHLRLRAESTDAARPAANAVRIAEAFAMVTEAVTDLGGNNSPQLVVEALYFKLRDVLKPALTP